MPLIESKFTTSCWLSNGHVQTVLPVLFPVSDGKDAVQRERLLLHDGDFVDLDWRRIGARQLAILSHGLEGNSRAVYMERMARALRTSGWDVLAWSYRGCSGEMNSLARFYHSGESSDLREVVDQVADGYDVVVLIGFSLGGNITLKYLGEAKPKDQVRAAVAISTPIDLAASAKVLDERRSNGIYLRRFIQSLVSKVELKAKKYPRELELEGLKKIRSFREFDRQYTAPLHGFVDEVDYWTKSSSRQFLAQLSVPTLLLNACDDPFLSEESFPFEIAKSSQMLFLETPRSGGHVGFVGKSFDFGWMGRRVIEFLQELR